MKNNPEYYEVLEQSFETPYAFCLKVNLKDKTDGEKLNKTVQMAVLKHPYMSARIVWENGDIRIVHNVTPVPVLPEGAEDVVLGSSTLNGHLMAVTYEEYAVHFIFLHALCSGKGALKFVKTALNCYYAGDKVFTGGSDSGGPAADRFYFSYESLAGEDAIPPGKVQQGYTVFSDIKPSPLKYYEIRIPVKNFIKTERSLLDSPVSAASVLMFKAQDRIIEDRLSDIVAVITHDYADNAGCAGSTYNMLRSVRVQYSRDFAEYDYETLTVLTRLQLREETLKERDVYVARQMLDYYEHIDNLETFNEKREYAINNSRYKEDIMPGFFLSYMGKKDFGEAEPHIDSVYCITASPFMIEITAFGDECFICFISSESVDYQMHAFLEELAANQIPYGVKGPFDVRSVRLEY